MVNRNPDGLPIINTHSLGKFAFCHRAGLIALASGEDDDSEASGRTPRLDYLPRFDIAAMVKLKDKLEGEMILVGVPLCLGIVLLVLVGHFYDPWLAAFIGLAALLPARLLYLYLTDYLEIVRRLLQVEDAELLESEVDTSSGFQKFSWWSLLKNKNVLSNDVKAEYRHDELGLCGRPARIISYQGTRIPVIAHQEELDEPKPYQIVRLAAYALLIEHAERVAAVPWGIILEPKSMEAMAVRLGEAEKKNAKALVTVFQQAIGQVAFGSHPKQPKKSFCRLCPYGRPRLYRAGRSETKQDGERLHPQTNVDRGGRRYHSSCGDRFQWIPPHELAFKKGFLE